MKATEKRHREIMSIYRGVRGGRAAGETGGERVGRIRGTFIHFCAGDGGCR